MLNPTRLGEDLLMFDLIHADDQTLVVEQDKPITGGPQIQCADVAGHM
jgi:hypothetical protein